MQIGPLVITLRKKALPPLRPLSSTAAWWPWATIRESFTGAWQQNVEIRADTALSFYAVYACVRLISTDMGKMTLRLVERNGDQVWVETESPSFSPVLRRPNRSQHITKFIEQWMLSKLLHGNAYVLLQRDQRRVVTAMYVLDPTRVKPLVTEDGGVYYELKRDDLSQLRAEMVVVPASEIIHDTMITPFHPLVGMTPLMAAGLSATQGLAIQNGSSTFFGNGNEPPGILTAPENISPETATDLLKTWKARRPGDIAVLAGDLKYTQLGMSARDAQLIEQLLMAAKDVCSAYGVPPYLVDIGDPPPYANFEPLLLKYHSQCIQSHTVNFEKSLEKGLGLDEKIDGRQLGVEFDVDDLIWMDTATRTDSASKAVSGSVLMIDEARKRYFGLGKVTGGNSIWMQQQDTSLKALAERDANATPPPQRQAPPATDDEEEMSEDDVKALAPQLLMKALERAA